MSLFGVATDRFFSILIVSLTESSFPFAFLVDLFIFHFLRGVTLGFTHALHEGHHFFFRRLPARQLLAQYFFDPLVKLNIVLRDHRDGFAGATRTRSSAYPMNVFL